ncbi:MAG: hypothetical protein NW206_19685 [Hyphomonadaceae bacterium]|nr:hypothetical protein [Hyphomonadaceae bacterium]
MAIEDGVTTGHGEPLSTLDAIEALARERPEEVREALVAGVRSARVDLFTPAEHALRQALAAIEAIRAANTHLSAASSRISEAQRDLGAFTDAELRRALGI